MEQIRLDEPTHYEAVLDVRYAIHWNALNERFYKHVDALIKILSLLLGSTAFGAYLANAPGLSGATGLLLALLTVFDVVVSPGRKVCAFNEAGRRFTDLDGRAHALSLHELKAALSTLRSEYAGGGLNALAAPAYNRALLANGRPDAVMPVSGWERFVAALA